MTSPLLESRRELRKCAFQALMSLEFGTDMETTCRFAYTHDREDADVQIPAFLMNLVSGVQAQKDELDKQINQHLKSGWTVERLTLVEKNLLRLGIFEITSFDTPQLVAVNEAIELAKNFSDQKSARFINGLLSQFITEENE
ncbi:transcription antitermination factor NusB [Streptococcus mitis]|uniref:transcription antitermination factor NusB n=1 Tax=Streptococcus mitis TaxID=28037 RepID=UPI001C1EEE6A|nr:transcription antitermination factor NusB [Streptococcus mitis]MBU6824803.1 transcription antitermination factor NusB [Streptococcus mitis]MDU4467432.1 transcription antitermination factor NusB [Streptococcus mitis]